MPSLANGYTVEVSPPVIPSVEKPSTSASVTVVPVRGPAGPEGPAGDGSPIEFVFATPAATWTLIHGRGTRPDVVLITDDDNDRVYTGVSYPDLSTAVVEWPSPTSGKAYIQ